MNKLITHNPYRTLGVWSNAPLRSIHANTTKLKAMNRVGKEVSFESDLTQLLPSVERDDESIQQAIAAINLPQDKIKHALFWFINASDMDEVALGHLAKGDKDHASKIFSMRPSFSSLINNGVLQFILGNNDMAINYISTVIHDTSNRIAFVKDICGDDFKIQETEMSHLFFDALITQISAQELVRMVKNEDDKTYCINIFADELVSHINAEIERAKVACKDDAKANLEAGKQLLSSTQSELSSLKELLSPSNLKYKQTADSLAERILQCAINHFNDAANNNDASEVIKLAEYATTIAEGDLVKERCKNNLAVIQDEINTLPPLEVSEENAKLLSLVEEFGKEDKKSTYIIESFIRKCKKQLKKICKKLGETHPFYLRVSTSICNKVLSAIVDSVNTSLNAIEPVKQPYNSSFGSMMYGYDVDAYNASVRRHNATVTTARQKLYDAWRLIKKLETFQVEEGFKTRLAENKESLRELCNTSKVSTDFKDNVLNHKYSKSIGRFNHDLMDGPDDMGCLGWFMLIPLIGYVIVWGFEFVSGGIINIISAVKNK